MGKIDIKDMDLFYGDFHAIKDVNLSIPKNQITAFIGPSGCGKSTVLKSLNRMNDLVVDCKIQGKITLDGVDIYKDMDVNDVREKVGKRKRHGNQRKSQPRNQLRGDDPELLGPEHLHQGTPKGFERPRQNNQRSPKRNAGIVDTQPSKHQRCHHVYDNEGESHRKIERGNPC